MHINWFYYRVFGAQPDDQREDELLNKKSNLLRFKSDLCPVLNLKPPKISTNQELVRLIKPHAKNVSHLKTPLKTLNKKTPTNQDSDSQLNQISYSSTIVKQPITKQLLINQKRLNKRPIITSSGKLITS